MWTMAIYKCFFLSSSSSSFPSSNKSMWWINISIWSNSFGQSLKYLKKKTIIMKEGVKWTQLSGHYTSALFTLSNSAYTYWNYNKQEQQTVLFMILYKFWCYMIKNVALD